MGVSKHKREDKYVCRLREELAKAYRAKHPRAQIDVKREYRFCVRVRVLDPDFARKDRLDRNEMVWEAIHTLPEDYWDQVSLLLLFTPQEAKTSLMNRFEFEELPPYIEESDSPKERAQRR
jgi:hypothetical protein